MITFLPRCVDNRASAAILAACTGGFAMQDDVTNASNCPWQILEEHFRHHARQVSHFRGADASAVVAMWNSGTNLAGEPLSQFEHDALVERYCELFGKWPEQPLCVGGSGEAQRLEHSMTVKGPQQLRTIKNGSGENSRNATSGRAFHGDHPPPRERTPTDIPVNDSIHRQTLATR